MRRSGVSAASARPARFMNNSNQRAGGMVKLMRAPAASSPSSQAEIGET